MPIKIINTQTTSPFENLQIEENLYQQIDNDNCIVLRFWQNDESVIMGRFQNQLYEVNNDFLLKHNIPVYKRKSGGGTVFHDLGVLNISLMKNKNLKLSPSHKKDIDFITHTLKNSLEKITNQTITANDRSALFIKSEKILGSAVQITKEYYLYHASILFDCNLEKLISTINWEPQYDENSYKVVKSHRSPVCNLKPFLKNVTMENFKKLLKTYLQESLESN